MTCKKKSPSSLTGFPLYLPPDPWLVILAPYGPASSGARSDLCSFHHT
jgi:hypothetical protein